MLFLEKLVKTVLNSVLEVTKKKFKSAHVLRKSHYLKKFK